MSSELTKKGPPGRGNTQRQGVRESPLSFYIYASFSPIKIMPASIFMIEQSRDTVRLKTLLLTIPGSKKATAIRRVSSQRFSTR